MFLSIVPSCTFASSPSGAIAPSEALRDKPRNASALDRLSRDN